MIPDRTIGGPEGKGRRLYFDAGGRILSAEINDPVLFEQARLLYPFYEIPPPEVGRSDIPEVKVASGLHGHAVTSRTAPAVVCGSTTEALAAFEFALTRAIVASFGEYVHLHASGAVANRQAVLALGKSGAGKSSLAVSWLAQGFPTLGDDIVFLNKAGNAIPFKRLLKVTPSALRTLAIDPATTIQWDPDWPEAWYAPDDACGWAREAPVAVIAVVRYDPQSSLNLTPLSKTEALNNVLHSMMDTGKRPEDCFDTLVRMVERARVFRVEYPSANEAAEALGSLTK